MLKVKKNKSKNVRFDLSKTVIKKDKFNLSDNKVIKEKALVINVEGVEYYLLPEFFDSEITKMLLNR